jgi:L-ascorbate metabolism protein UlaG (beta-lactamase superfamily)
MRKNGVMPTIRRLGDSCVLVTTDDDVVLIDPGVFAYQEGDLAMIGDVSRVLITHEHRDHAHPEFVRWLLDRRRDLTVHSNQAVADLMADHGIDVSTGAPPGVSFEDVLHEPLPTGATPPNRAFTLDDIFTHPGDSQRIATTAPVLALPLIAPWTSTAAAVEFARRLRPRQVFPIHDFFLSESGRQFITGLAKGVLDADGIELVPLGWGDHYSF